MSQANETDTNGYVTRNLGCVPGTSTPLKPSPYSITPQADGKVVVAGATTASGSSVPGDDNMFAMRFMDEQDGKGNIVDTGFDGEAEKLVAISTGSGRASGACAAAIDTDGAISMAGWGKSAAYGVWVSNKTWYEAREAYRAGTATNGQKTLLKRGRINAE